ncbi:tRNA pseudouridine(13) synthase TruD, partial [Acinetobacter baumannii]
AGEVHPTGPLPGDGASVVTDDVAALEAGVLAPWEDVCADLAALRVPGQRRSLRLRVDDLVRQQPQPDVLVLSFTLAAGSFATAVLASLARL